MLNAEQQCAITHVNGPMMVIAGPGSGKTTVITQRIRHLTQEVGIDASHILVITYTKAAAKEMQCRYEALLSKPTTQGVTFGTFHAIFWDILKKRCRLGNENIIDRKKQREFFRQYVKEILHQEGDENERVENLMDEVAKVKESDISLESYHPMDMTTEEFSAIYHRYQNDLKERRLLDFEDMAVYTERLFQEEPQTLLQWQKKFRYILVDEFQDINRIQYRLVKMLAEPQNNVMIVGDDDQSIYRFRGACPEIMLGFAKDYPRHKRVNLSINYRSCRGIIEMAKRLISHNSHRYEKDIIGHRKEVGKVEVLSFSDETKQNQYLVQAILRAHREGTPWEDMAILVRTGYQPSWLVRSLDEHGIPFQMKNQLPSLYQNRIAKDILAYLRLACGIATERDLLRIMNKPVRYFTRDAVFSCGTNFRAIHRYFRSKPWMQEKISDLEADLNCLRRLTPKEGIAFILDHIGYRSTIDREIQEHQIDSEVVERVLNFLLQMAGEAQTHEKWFSDIEDYERLLKEKYSQRQVSQGIFVQTIHSAKGLEFQKVFIPDVNEGYYPFFKAKQKEDIEEERRLLYVAMTRAITSLTMLYVKERGGKEVEPSVFLSEC